MVNHYVTPLHFAYINLILCFIKVQCWSLVYIWDNLEIKHLFRILYFDLLICSACIICFYSTLTSHISHYHTHLSKCVITSINELFCETNI